MQDLLPPFTPLAIHVPCPVSKRWRYHHTQLVVGSTQIFAVASVSSYMYVVHRQVLRYRPCWSDINSDQRSCQCVKSAPVVPSVRHLCTPEDIESAAFVEMINWGEPGPGAFCPRLPLTHAYGMLVSLVGCLFRFVPCLLTRCGVSVPLTIRAR